MRKTLLTTTALVMTAGAAAAEISITGQAELGLAGSERATEERDLDHEPGCRSESNPSGTICDSIGGNILFHTDIDVTFEMSGVTDGGLEFSTAVDLDENDAFDDDDTHGGVAITLSGGFGNIALGDADGAFDWAMTETDVGGSLRDEHTDHYGFSGNGGGSGSGLDGANDGQIFRYDTAVGPLGFALSAELDDEIDGSGGETGSIVGLGTTYSVGLGGGTLDLGFGYQSGETSPYIDGERDVELLVGASVVGASASYSTAWGLSAIMNWSAEEYDDATITEDGEMLTLTGLSNTHVGFGLGYKTGPFTIGVNWGTFDYYQRHPNLEVVSIPVIQLDSNGDLVMDSGDPVPVYINAADEVVTDIADAVGILFEDFERTPTYTEERTGFGLSVVYDLGGGAALQLGYSSGGYTQLLSVPGEVRDVTAPNAGTGAGTTTGRAILPAAIQEETIDRSVWSIGLAFNF